MNAEESQGSAAEAMNAATPKTALKGSQVARLAQVLADEWREEHTGAEHDAAKVLDRLAAAFDEIDELDEQACVVMLAGLDVELEAEWGLVDALRAAIEDRSWLRHPSRNHPSQRRTTRS